MHYKNHSLKKRRFLLELPITYWIIFFNAALFIVFSITFAFMPESSSNISLQARSILNGERWWTLITSMFWHHGVFHIFVNMFSLFFLGTLSEQIIGRKRFLWLYMAAGLFAGIAFVVFAKLGSFVSWGGSVFGGIDVSAAGASGAIFGLLGLLAVLIPRYKVYLVVGPLIAFLVLVIAVQYLPGAMSAVLSLVINLLVFLMIFSMFSHQPFLRKIALPVQMPLWVSPIAAILPLFILSFYVVLPIGNSAHLGGLVMGLVFGIYLRLKYPQKVILLEKFFR